MNKTDIDIIKERYHNDEVFLMETVTKLLNFDAARAANKLSFQLVPIWTGHKTFLKSIQQWYANKQYLTNKQITSVIKILDKYLDRIIKIYDSLAADVTGSDFIAVFSMMEFDNKCPECGSRNFSASKVISPELTYKCGSCGFEAIFISEDDEQSDEEGEIKNSIETGSWSNAELDDLIDSMEDNVDVSDSVIKLVGLFSPGQGIYTGSATKIIADMVDIIGGIPVKKS